MPDAAVTTVESDTVHTAGVLEMNDTGSPEVADAAKVTGLPTLTAGGWVKVIVCGCFPGRTRNERATSRAGS